MLLAKQFLAESRRHWPIVLGRVEDVPDEVAEIGVGHLFEPFGHEGQFAGARFVDVGACDDEFGWAGGD